MICGKQIYASRTAAKEAISGMNNDRFLPVNEHVIERKIINGTKVRPGRKLKSKKSSMRAYFCDACNGWHVTTNGKKSKSRKPSSTETLDTIHKKVKKEQLKLRANSNNPKFRIYDINKFKVK